MNHRGRKCAHCAYDLSGLAIDSRCPECGAFTRVAGRLATRDGLASRFVDLCETYPLATALATGLCVVACVTIAYGVSTYDRSHPLLSAPGRWIILLWLPVLLVHALCWRARRAGTVLGRASVALMVAMIPIVASAAAVAITHFLDSAAFPSKPAFWNRSSRASKLAGTPTLLASFMALTGIKC
jgi:hypothetical protein